MRFETRAADGVGRVELAGGAVPGRLGWRDVRKVAAVLRTWEKSWMVLLVGYYFPMEAIEIVGRQHVWKTEPIMNRLRE